MALIGLAAICTGRCGTAVQAAFRPDIRPGYGVTTLKWLSDYNNPRLRGTDYDTPVYVMEGEKSGAVALILVGTYAREIGGTLTAAVVLEKTVIEQGKFFVIPCVNAAGMAVPDELG